MITEVECLEKKTAHMTVQTCKCSKCHSVFKVPSHKWIPDHSFFSRSFICCTTCDHAVRKPFTLMNYFQMVISVIVFIASIYGIYLLYLIHPARVMLSMIMFCFTMIMVWAFAQL